MTQEIENLETFAEERITLLDSLGEKRPGNIFLGVPVFYEGDEKYPESWYCYIYLKGLTGHSMVAGDSSLHSLLSALCFIQNKLDEFLATGGKILYENGEKNFYLPHFIRLDFFGQRLFEVND